MNKIQRGDATISGRLGNQDRIESSITGSLSDDEKSEIVYKSIANECIEMIDDFIETLRHDPEFEKSFKLIIDSFKHQSEQERNDGYDQWASHFELEDEEVRSYISDTTIGSKLSDAQIDRISVAIGERLNDYYRSSIKLMIVEETSGAIEEYSMKTERGKGVLIAIVVGVIVMILVAVMQGRL